MQISVNDRWARFIAEQMATGAFDSPDGVVAEALHLLQAQRRQLNDLQMMVEASLAEGGDMSDADLDAVLAAELKKLEQAGR